MRKLWQIALGAAAGTSLLALTAAAAQAAVIVGPKLNLDGLFWIDTGLEFTARDNSFLTSFVYQNQGKADTIDLTTTSGAILDSLKTPKSEKSYKASVDWKLTAGDSYWLIQTKASNELLAVYGKTLSSDHDIKIAFVGSVGNTIHQVVTDAEHYSANGYWVAFNNITTAAAAVPEPSTWALMLLGFAGLGFGGYRASRKRAADAA